MESNDDVFYTLKVNKYAKLYVYQYYNKENEKVYSIGMTPRHKSCLIMKESDVDTLFIVALSTRKKYTRTLKNPLGISRNAKHMPTWLYMAKVFAKAKGYKALKLFDAANVIIQGNFTFLSSVTLLKDHTFVYGKYGFITDNVLHGDVLQRLSLVSPQQIVQYTPNIQLKMILRKADSWSAVYKSLAYFNCLFLCEHIIEILGYNIKDLQFYYTCPVHGVTYNHFEMQELKNVPHWLETYNDRSMDVF